VSDSTPETTVPDPEPENGAEGDAEGQEEEAGDAAEQA